MLQSITVPSPVADQLAKDGALGWVWCLALPAGDSGTPRRQGENDSCCVFGCCVTTLHPLDPQLTSGSPCWTGAEPRAAFCTIITSRTAKSPQQGASPAWCLVPPAAGCAGGQRWVALLSPPSSAAIPHSTHRHSMAHTLHPLLPHPQPCSCCAPNPCISSYHCLGR